MIKTPVAAALVVALALPAVAPAAADTAPTRPGSARIALYAGAGGELFWSRSTDDRGVRGYEITKNGRNLGTRDATSYYDASLRANTAYTFTIVAVDTAGQRSPAATVRVAGGAPAAPAAPTTPTTPATPAPGASPVAPVAGAPAAPTGLRASVYSTSNAELFWNRPSTAGLRYEVRRDGGVVATTDGVSHYASGLVAGRDYAWQVIAIDRSGRRSAPASVSVRTGGGTGPQASAPSTPSAPSTGAPSTPTAPATPAAPSQPAGGLAAIAPRNVSIKVYSANAAELFWTPAGSARPLIQKNEIRRDGTLIGTTPGEFASSFFDDTRRPGESYTYTITAISSAGRGTTTFANPAAGAPATPTAPATPAPAPTTPSTPAPAAPSNAALPAATRTRLDNQFDLMNAVALEKIGAIGARLADDASYRAGSPLGLRSVGFDDIDPSQPDVRVETFACPNGGGVRDVVFNAGPRRPGDRSLEVTDCAIGPLVFSGRFTIDANRNIQGLPGPSTYIDVSGVEVDDSRDLSTIRMGNSMIEYDQASRAAVTGWFMSDLSVELPDRSYSARFVQGDGADRGNALPDGSVGLTVNADAVNGSFATNGSLRTRGPFEFRNGRAEGRPVAGRVTLASAAGEWTIDAFNGDASSFQLNSTVGGATTSTTVPWSARYRFDAPSLRGVDLGF